MTYSYGNENEFDSLTELSRTVCDSILLSDKQRSISLLCIRVDGIKLGQKSNSDIYSSCFDILKKKVSRIRDERREKVKRRLDEELDSE